MKKAVYIETSIFSYLTARPSRNLIAAAWQQSTVEWWDSQRERFDLYVSEVVVQEAKRGDREAAERRLAELAGIPLLSVTDAVVSLARTFVDEGAIPKVALDDAIHVAVAAVHGVDYLLTWNCRHIDNAEIKPVLRSLCAVKGHACPEICNPPELMGAETDE